MHERPIGDLVDALRPLGCTIDDLGKPGYPPLRVSGSAGGTLAIGAADPRARRRLEPVPDRAAAGAAAGRRRRSDGRDRGRRRADLQALHRDHAEPAGALRHRGAARRLAALHDPGRQPPTARRATSMSRAMPRRPRTSSRSAPSPPTAARRCASRASGIDSIQGDIRFVEAAQAMGARVRRRPGLARACAAAPGRCRRSTLDCNHIPDAAMTLAVMALYADGTTRLTQHRQLARQGDRPHRRDGGRAAQARRHRRSKAPTSSRSRRRTQLAARRRSTPTTTTAWRCACRWPPSTRWPAPTRRCRCASSTRTAWPRPSPTTSRRCSASPTPRRRTCR